MSAAPKRGNKPSAPPPAAKAADAPHSPHVFTPHPFKPRPVLLAVISVIFALWVAFLVVLYFKTIYPRRSVSPLPDATGGVLEGAATAPAR